MNKSRSFVISFIIMEFIIILAGQFLKLLDKHEISILPNLYSALIQIIAVLGISVILMFRYTLSLPWCKRIKISDVILSFTIISIIYTMSRLLWDGFQWVGYATDILNIPVTRLNSTSQNEFISMILLSGFIPSFCEEIYYRYIGMCFFNDNRNGIIIISMMFGAAHFRNGIATVIFTAILGFGLGQISSKTQNIYLCISSHLLFNILTLINDYVYPFPSDSLFIYKSAYTKSVCGFYGCIFLLIGIILLAVLSLMLSNKHTKSQLCVQ